MSLWNYIMEKGKLFASEANRKLNNYPGGDKRTKQVEYHLFDFPAMSITKLQNTKD